MARKILVVGPDMELLPGPTAEALVRIGRHLDDLEAALEQVALEALEFYYNRHCPYTTARLARAFLWAVAWELGDRLGWEPTEEVQKKALKGAGKRMGGEVGWQVENFLNFL